MHTPMQNPGCTFAEHWRAGLAQAGTTSLQNFPPGQGTALWLQTDQQCETKDYPHMLHHCPL